MNPTFIDNSTDFILSFIGDPVIGGKVEGIGALTYFVPTPSVLGILGAGLMLMGYMAYRRRKA